MSRPPPSDSPLRSPPTIGQSDGGSVGRMDRKQSHKTIVEFVHSRSPTAKITGCHTKCMRMRNLRNNSRPSTNHFEAPSTGLGKKGLYEVTSRASHSQMKPIIAKPNPRLRGYVYEQAAPPPCIFTRRPSPYRTFRYRCHARRRGARKRKKERSSLRPLFRS